MENHKYGRTLHNHEPTDGGSDVEPGALASDQTEEHQPEDVTEQLQHVQHQPEVAAPRFDDLDKEQGDNLCSRDVIEISQYFQLIIDRRQKGSLRNSVDSLRPGRGGGS